MQIQRPPIGSVLTTSNHILRLPSGRCVRACGVRLMPVKVRCPSCEKVLNVPDTARGKAVKCPACEARVPVPAESAAAAPAKAGAVKTAAKPAAAKKKAVEDD